MPVPPWHDLAGRRRNSKVRLVIATRDEGHGEDHGKGLRGRGAILCRGAGSGDTGPEQTFPGSEEHSSDAIVATARCHPGTEGEMARTASTAEVANKTNGHDPAQTIEQVRELLFGESQRSNDTRIGDLDGKVEAMRADMLDRLARLEARLVDLGRDTETRRLASIEDIGAAIAGLGASVRNMGARKSG
jgi:hypothetical protein